MAPPSTAVPETLLRRAGPEDRAAVEQLLTALDLPRDGVAAWIERFWVAEAAGRIVAVAGTELYADGALLRSVAVVPAWRGSGLGRTLVERALDAAQASGTRDAYLLTTTAERYFPRLGFEPVTREDVPASVRESVEFRSACPASAVVMRKRLDPLPTTLRR